MRQKTRTSKRKNPPRWMYFALLAVIALCLGIIIAILPDMLREDQRQPVQREVEPVEISPVVEPSSPPESVIPVPVEHEPIKLYLVIDDVGNNMVPLADFLLFEGGITFAVMPKRPFTTESAIAAGKAGHQVIMHQPMEPYGGQDPGPAAIFTEMDEEEISRILDDNFSGIPGVVGMNNHMGSKATSDPSTMKSVFSYLAREKLFFLDSVTTSESVAQLQADAAGVPFAFRNALFLDNDQGTDAINQKIDEGLAKAKVDGYAILIGHVWNENLPKVLTERYLSIIDEGFSFEFLSEFYSRRNAG